MTDKPTGKAMVRTRTPISDDILRSFATDADSANKLLAFQVASTLERSQMIRHAAVEMANTQWGAKLSEVARGAVSRWCLSKGIDPLRHIYILGGRIYDNAELYIDKAAGDPRFSHYEIELCAPLDTREIDAEKVGKQGAVELVREQRALNARKLHLQMVHGVPPEIEKYPDTACAAVVRVYFLGVVEPVAVGCKWAGSMGRRRQRRQGDQMVEGGVWDPVGDGAPVQTAITRAMRKALKQKISLSFDAKGGDEALTDVYEIIDQGRQALKAGPQDDFDRLDTPQKAADNRVKLEAHGIKDGGYGTNEDPATMADAAPLEEAGVQQPEEGDPRVEGAGQPATPAEPAEDTVCFSCGEPFREEDMKDVDGEPFCPACAEEENVREQERNLKD